MPLIIKRRTDIHPLDAYLQGLFPCPRCGGIMSLEGMEPLGKVNCAYCNETIVVPQRVGDFWLYELLGGGGMGAVYRAYHFDFRQRFFAVKILPRGKKKKHPRLIRNLQNEATIARNLGEHPCLVRILDCGFADDEHYMAMDFIDGERMDKKVKRLGQLSENETMLVSLRLISGVSHIYNQGYLYRDLKPQNIILSYEEGAYLYDFGICQTVEEALEEPEDDVVAGTPLFFAPERLTADSETPASEIYSLGMVMYFALTGNTYFTTRELETSGKTDIRPALLQSRDKMAGIDPELSAIVQRMIQREPAKRYQTFQEVEREITRILWLRLRRSEDGQLLT